MKIILIALLAGVLAGLLGALCGVGGGIVMVPIFIQILNLDQKTAVATSLAVIVVTAIVATSNNIIKSDIIDWKIAGIAAVGAIISAWFGADLMKTLSNATLNTIFACCLIVFGVLMLVKN